MMRALDDVVRSGKVHYIAISDSPAWQVSRANTIAELRGWRLTCSFVFFFFILGLKTVLSLRSKVDTTLQRGILKQKLCQCAKKWVWGSFHGAYLVRENILIRMAFFYVLRSKINQYRFLKNLNVNSPPSTLNPRELGLFSFLFILLNYHRILLATNRSLLCCQKHFC